MSFKGLALLLLVLFVCPMAIPNASLVGGVLGDVSSYWIEVAIMVFKAIIQRLGGS